MNSQKMQQLVEQELLSSYDSLYRLAYTYVKNESDAMDIVQESSYKAIKNSSSVKNAAFIKTWLWRIVINTSLEVLRKNQREVSFDAAKEQGKEDIYLDFDTIDALDILNEKERAVIVLRYFEERKLQEIADVLEENLNTTKSILYRSLGKLRIKLTEGELSHES
ncbi:sigma-70 family RNA polymerase sigma factor [Petralouisia muris]|uniref:Sigma-70 family RNA polymerase sigma factor n=1 Tax=Petralouisia muris TaxID=3032872 RepID=A0AC61RZL2_9FIRM|nr:sigma-70 family RNA polymerase sigma factor [Petralouisia muris]TGY97494.1 sigma-70 family RNA polymerase sigma factor [Petralouisia muris]